MINNCNFILQITKEVSKQTPKPMRLWFYHISSIQVSRINWKVIYHPQFFLHVTKFHSSGGIIVNSRTFPGWSFIKLDQVDLWIKVRPHPTISFVIGNIIFFPHFIPFLAHEVKFIGVGHQQPWYWLCWTKIIRSPHIKDWNLQTYSKYILKLILCQIYHSCLILLVIAHDGWHYIASFTKGCLSSEVFPLSKKEVQLKLWKSYPNQWLSASLNRGKSVNLEIWIIHKQQLCQDMDFNKNKNSNTSPNMYEEYNINMKNSNGSKWLKFQIVNMVDNSPCLSFYTKYLKQMGFSLWPGDVIW